MNNAVSHKTEEYVRKYRDIKHIRKDKRIYDLLSYSRTNFISLGPIFWARSFTCAPNRAPKTCTQNQSHALTEKQLETLFFVLYYLNNKNNNNDNNNKNDNNLYLFSVKKQFIITKLTKLQ